MNFSNKLGCFMSYPKVEISNIEKHRISKLFGFDF